MNKQRRKAIEKVCSDIANARAELESLRDEEQEYRDAMPEQFANGEKGEQSDAMLEAMQEAMDSLEEAENRLRDDVIAG